MSRPGTASSDLETVQSRIDALKEELNEEPPKEDDVRELFKIESYVDEAEVAARALWGLLDSPGEKHDGERCSLEEYRLLMQGILTLSGLEHTAAQTLSHRLQQMDSLGGEPVRYPAFKARILQTVATMWPPTGPAADASSSPMTAMRPHEQIAFLYKALSEEGGPPPPGADAADPRRQLRSPGDVQPLPAQGTPCQSLRGMSCALSAPLPASENCFLLIGDPCVGKTALGKAISERLNAVHLDVVRLAFNEMRRGTELGGFIADQLREKAPIEMDLQAELISNEMQSPAVRIRGYVFDDFPILPASANGDVMLQKWLDWCGVRPSARYIVSITAHDSTSPADEWRKLFTAKQQQWRALEDAESALRETEDAAEAVRNEKLRAKEERQKLREQAEADGGEAPPEEAEEEEEVPEEEKARRAAEAEAAVERRALHDLAAVIHMGRMVWLREGGGDESRGADSWEGDTPFLSPASHVELSATIDSAVARGCYHELSHIDSVEDKIALIFTRCGCLKAAELPSVPQHPTPEAELLSEPEEAIEAGLLEALTSQGVSFSPVWGKLCPVTYSDEGVAVAGTCLLPSVYQGSLFIFTSKGCREKFLADPVKYLAQRPKMKNRSLMVVASKPDLLQDSLGAGEDQLSHEALRGLDYGFISLQEYHEVWQRYNQKEAGKMLQFVERQRELQQNLLEEQEKAKAIVKAQKKKKGDDKKKKKKGDKKEEKAEEEKAEEEQQKEEPEEVRELNALERKEQEVQDAVRLSKNDLSLFVSALHPDPEKLAYLQKLNLLPSTVILLTHRSPGDPAEGDDTDAPAAGEADAEDAPPEGDDAPPAPPVDAPPDLTDPRQYSKHMDAFIASLTQAAEGEGDAPPEEEGVPAEEGAAADPAAEVDYTPKQPKKSISVETICVGDLSSVAEVVGAISKRLDAFVPKAVAEEPGAGDGEEDEAGGGVDKRLIPGITPDARCGSTLRYCPVTLVAERLLVQGNPEISAAYDSRRWFFRSEAEREKFFDFPQKYAKRIQSADDGLPPPALWVAGARVADLPQFCNSIRDGFGVEPLDFLEIDAIADRLGSGAAASEEAAKALSILSERRAFEAEQRRKQEQKEAVLQRQEEEDGTAEEMPPELEEFEPEDDEAKAERVVQSQIKMLKHLTRAAPYREQGYILLHPPTKEDHLDLLRDAGVVPECLVVAGVDRAAYIRMRCATELPTRIEAYNAKVQAAAQRKSAAEERRREKDLRKWRRRNIGADDEDEEDAEEEEEEIAPVNIEEVQEEMGAACDEEAAEVETLRGKVAELRGEVLEVDFTLPGEAALCAAMLSLRRRLAHRPSLLCAPYLTTHDDAERLIRTSQASISSFGRTTCPVSHHKLCNRLSALETSLVSEKPGFEAPPSVFPVLKPPRRVFDTSDGLTDDAPKAQPRPAGGGEDGEGAEEEPAEEEAEAEEEEADDPDDPEAAAKRQEAVRQAAAAAERVRLRIMPYPVLFDGVVYFCESEEHVLAFIDHPVRYAVQQPSIPLHVSCNPALSMREDVPIAVHEIPVLVAVVGSAENKAAGVAEGESAQEGRAEGDGVGCTEEQQRRFLAVRQGTAERSVAEHVAHNMGLVCITKSKLIKTFLKMDTTLSDILLEKVLSREDIPESLLVTLVFMRLAMADVKIRGCVLDGIVTTMGIAERLEQEISSIATVHNFIICNDDRLHKWGRLHHFYTDYYDNVTHVPQKASLVSQVAMSIRAIELAADERRLLSIKRFSALPAVVHKAAQPESAVTDRLAKYGDYCCHEWVHRKILIECKLLMEEGRRYTGMDVGQRAHPHTGPFRAEYGNWVYNFSSLEGVKAFIANPAVYEDVENKHVMLKHVPRKLVLGEAETITHFDTTDWSNPKKTMWEFKGFCPVTLYETRDDVGLMNRKQPTCNFGSIEYAAQVDDKFYRMCSQQCLDRFMQAPWTYIEGVQLPEHLPIPKAALFDMSTVSMPSFIKEALYDAVVKAMLDAGKTRPGFPGTSARNSAIRYVAAHLRAHNPANTPLKARVYKKNFEGYKEACELPQFFLGEAAAAATDEERNRKAALWQDIRDKKREAAHYEHFNLEE